MIGVDRQFHVSGRTLCHAETFCRAGRAAVLVPELAGLVEIAVNGASAAAILRWILAIQYLID